MLKKALAIKQRVRDASSNAQNKTRTVYLQAVNRKRTKLYTEKTTWKMSVFFSYSDY